VTPKYKVERVATGEIYGPYTLKQIIEYYEQGLLSPEDLIYTPQGTRRVKESVSFSGTDRDLSIPSTMVPQAKAKVPKEVKKRGFCWAAFVLGLIWVIGNKAWMPGLLLLIEFIPYVGWLWGLALRIYLGVTGHQLAWESREFESLQQYQDTMNAWHRGTMIYLWFVVGSIVIWSIIFISLIGSIPS